MTATKDTGKDAQKIHASTKVVSPAQDKVAKHLFTPTGLFLLIA